MAHGAFEQRGPISISRRTFEPENRNRRTDNNREQRRTEREQKKQKKSNQRKNQNRNRNSIMSMIIMFENILSAA